VKNARQLAGIGGIAVGLLLIGYLVATIALGIDPVYVVGGGDDDGTGIDWAFTMFVGFMAGVVLLISGVGLLLLAVSEHGDGISER
jgi:hypothetical protein